MPCDLADAARFVGDADRRDFARRQVRSRRRLQLLITFYAGAPCRMANVHLLAAHAITLGRFCGVSATFDAIGDELMPVDNDGAPRSAAWIAYAKAGATKRPVDVRDELWLAAHVEDNERLRTKGLDVAFADEASRHHDEPIWALLRQHMDVTVGARLVDRSALTGLVAPETILADGLLAALGRLVRTGWQLMARYVVEAARAPSSRPRASLRAGSPATGARRWAWRSISSRPGARRAWSVAACASASEGARAPATAGLCSTRSSGRAPPRSTR